MHNNSPNVVASKIAVLILSTRSKNYAKFIDAIRTGWAADFRALNIPCYFYEGGHTSEAIHQDQIKLTVKDDLKFSARKLKSAIKVLLDAHPDTAIVYRTNLSSYIDISPFLKFVNANKMDEYSYIGIPGKTAYIKELWYDNRLWQKFFTLFPIGRKVVFASGSGFFLGRNHLDRITGDEDGEVMRLVDDVMVAVKLGIAPDVERTPCRLVYEANGSHRLKADVYDELISKKFLFHYRFKTENRDFDAEMLRLFHEPSFRRNICVEL